MASHVVLGGHPFAGQVIYYLIVLEADGASFVGSLTTANLTPPQRIVLATGVGGLFPVEFVVECSHRQFQAVLPGTCLCRPDQPGMAMGDTGTVLSFLVILPTSADSAGVPFNDEIVRLSPQAGF